MNSNILTIMKKEFSRFFRDRRLMITTLLLPGLLIYAVYSFMGSALTDLFSVDADYRPTVFAENLPESIYALSDQAPIALYEMPEDASAQDCMDSVAEQKLDLFVRFPGDFDAAVAAYDPASGAPAPNVEIYYNSTKTQSQAAYSALTALLDAYESAMANKFDVNAGTGGYDLATEEDSSAMFFSMLLPMLLMMFMFSGCMSVAPESIAGEKERGTIAALLVTPMKRSYLAIGKIASLGAISLLCGLSSFVGTILALPKLMEGSGMGMSAAVYGISEYSLLVLTILSTVLLLVSLISVISTFAKSVKEASTAVMPLMILVMILGLSGMFGGGVPTSPLYYCIPLYNSAQCLSSIFSFSASVGNVLITAAANLLVTGLCVVLLTRMFNSEKIMSAN